jgi:hypothetical protein
LFLSAPLLLIVHQSRHDLHDHSEVTAVSDDSRDMVNGATSEWVPISRTVFNAWLVQPRIIREITTMGLFGIGIS